MFSISSRSLFSSLLATLFLAALTVAPAVADEIQATPASDSGKSYHSEGSGSEASGHSGYSHHSSQESEGSGGAHHGYSHESKHGSMEGGHGYSGHGHGTHHSSHHSGHHSGHHGDDPFEHILLFVNALSLTDAQVADIKKLQFGFKKFTIEAKAALKIAYMELNQTMHSENVDEEKARKLAAEIGDNYEKLTKARVEGKLAALKLLTDEQRKKVNAMYSKHN